LSVYSSDILANEKSDSSDVSGFEFIGEEPDMGGGVFIEAVGTLFESFDVHHGVGEKAESGFALDDRGRKKFSEFC